MVSPAASAAMAVVGPLQPPRAGFTWRCSTWAAWIRKIDVGYYTAPALRVLSKNYLGVGDDGCENVDADLDAVSSLIAKVEGLLTAARVRTRRLAGPVSYGQRASGASAGGGSKWSR
ncbi:hypothetical protein PVAP13_5NG370600 [Panicum virgatum]|uniref:Uncharacterized protein n=1 Tax=Panicum virgatum TaxID=38727 RepID=A0A8T0RYN0_PANVG|nr:hypothetical protein PVAP13_5NG370600 [Panicum virgatum]